jgi:Uma2 family endonuclease
MEKNMPQILHLRLPKGMIFTEDQMVEFSQINHKKVESMIEDGYFTLIIHLMGNYTKAAKFTAKIMIALGIWNNEKKLGEIYPETLMYRVKEHTYREADTTFIAFAKVSREEQESWLETSAQDSATLLFEISSTTSNASIDLKKTIQFWIPFGTKYAIVVDLEEKKWYFFNGSTTYTTHDFSEKFVAPSDLPDLVLDFEEIARECGF